MRAPIERVEVRAETSAEHRMSEREEAAEAASVSSRTWVIFAGLMVTCVALLVAGLGGIGIWEPWEASELQVAQEYGSRSAWDASEIESNPRAPGYNWAVPTSGAKPVAFSLLKAWAASVWSPESGAPIADVIGDLEWGARAPVALAVVLLCGALFWSVRRRFGDVAAGVSALAFATLPVTYIGVRSLGTEQLFVVTTSLALLALFELRRAEGVSRWGWALASALALSLSFLDQRMIGLWVPGWAMGMWALASAAREADSAPRAPEIALALAAVFAPLAPMLASGEPGAWLDVEHHAQLLFVACGWSWLVALWVLARRGRVARALVSAPGVLAWAIPLGVMAWVLHSYGAVNPTLLDGGEVAGAIPSLRFALEHQLFAQSAAKEHVHFDLWLRQVGFATLPWAALIPAGLGYLAVRGRDETEAGEYATFALSWAIAALFVVAAASMWGHVFYPAWAPLALAAGVMLTDREWWARMRREPVLLVGIGFVAVAIVMMLGKDVERYPHRFFEVFVAMETKIGLPDGFTYGRSFKGLKYTWALVLAAGVFGFGSWAVLAFRRVAKEAPARWRAEREEAGRLRALARVVAALWGEDAPMERQRARKEELLREPGPIAGALRWFEGGWGLASVWSVVALVSAVAFSAVYIPRLGLHLSQRHVFETYLERAASTESEPLYRHQTSRSDASLYLEEVPQITSTRDFVERFEQPGRFFAVIPRDRLAALNYEVRKKTGRGLPVIESRGSKLLLVSNTLGEGEEDLSPIKGAIVEDKEDFVPQHPVAFETGKGEEGPVVFDNKLEFLGYALDKEGETPTYAWGEEIELTLYFKVRSRVSGNQKLFVHIDTSGNRIHGDHYPLGGAFPTNYWPVGEIVADTHRIKVGNYATQGAYTINFGLFMGSKRMKAKPKKAHDGRNRVEIGKLRVSL